MKLRTDLTVVKLLCLTLGMDQVWKRIKGENLLLNFQQLRLIRKELEKSRNWTSDFNTTSMYIVYLNVVNSTQYGGSSVPPKMYHKKMF